VTFHPLLTCARLTAHSGVLRADDPTELLHRVRGDMNTVAVVNVREINETPRAVKEK